VGARAQVPGIFQSHVYRKTTDTKENSKMYNGQGNVYGAVVTTS